MVRVLIVVAVALTVTGIAVDVAAGHYRTDERWLFGGALTKRPDSRDKLDPINLIFYPRAIRYENQGDSGKFQRADDHMQQHVRPNFVDQEGLLSTACYNQKYLSMPARHEPRVGSEFSWVAWDSQSGQFDRCRTRYHARVWYDHHTPHATGHPEPETWFVSPTHHERTNLARGFRQPRGHFIDRGWELVERDIIRKMRARPRDTTHRDPTDTDERAGLGHCTDYRWRQLPGSIGWFGAVDDLSGRPGSSRRGFYSDGWLSRISMVHCARQAR